MCVLYRSMCVGPTMGTIACEGGGLERGGGVIDGLTQLYINVVCVYICGCVLLGVTPGLGCTLPGP